MITLTLWQATALALGLGLTGTLIIKLGMRLERRRFRTAIHAVERGFARKKIGDKLHAEYSGEITDLRQKNLRMTRELREVRIELSDTMRERDTAELDDTTEAVR